MFSSIDGPLSIFIRSWDDNSGSDNERYGICNIIRIWCPYDVADPDHDTTTRLITMPGRHWHQLDNEEFNDSHTQWGTNGLQGNALFYRQWYQVCCNIRAARSIIRFTPDDKLHLLQQHPWISILEYNNRKGHYTKSKNRIQ